MAPRAQPAEFAALAQQVTGLETDYRDLKSVVVNLDRKIDASNAAILAKIELSQAPRWQAYGVMLTAVLAIGALAYWPIRENQSDLKESIKALSQSVVYLRRYENNQSVIHGELEKLRQQSNTKEFSAARFADIQRQIDELKRK